MERAKGKRGGHQLVQVAPDSSPPCRSTPRSATGSTRRKLAHSSLSALAVLSLSSTAPYLSTRILFALVPAQLVALFVGVAASERLAGRTPSVGVAGQDKRWRGCMLVYGASLAAGGLATVCAARGLHPVVWTGAEITSVSFSVLELREQSPRKRQHVVALAVCAATALLLLGKSAPLEFVVLIIFACALDHERRKFERHNDLPSHFLLGAASIGIVLSTLSIPIIVTFANSFVSPMNLSDTLLSLIFILASAAGHLSSTLTLPLLPSIDVSLLVPARNLQLLVIWSLFTGELWALGGVWLPLVAVNGVGAAAAFEVELALFFQCPIAIPRTPTNSTFIPTELSSTSETLPRNPAIASRVQVIIALLPFATFFLLLTSISDALPQSLQSPSRLQPLCTYLGSPSPLCDTAQLGSIDIVMSYLNEEPKEARQTIDHIKMQHFFSLRKARVVVYNKGGARSEELKRALGADEVVQLPNRGGEGGTYLHHILSRYNASITALERALSATPPQSQVYDPHGLASHTIFLLPLHLEPRTRERLALVNAQTGFANLGENTLTKCGNTSMVVDYKHYQEIHGVFRGELCPTDGYGSMQSMSESGRFAVSRRRILATPRQHFSELKDLLESSSQSWIHKKWGPKAAVRGGPGDPALGTTLRKAWSIIFNCA